MRASVLVAMAVAGVSLSGVAGLVLAGDATIRPGVYVGEGWSDDSFPIGDGDRCSQTTQKRLSLTVQPDGSVRWAGLYRVDGECRSAQFESMACWTYGRGQIVVGKKGAATLQLEPTSRATVPPMPDGRTVWKCPGGIRVVTDDGESPTRGCVRVGIYEDARDMRGAQIACNFSKTDFPEIEGARASIRKNGIELRLQVFSKKRKVVLKWSAPPPEIDAGVPDGGGGADDAASEDRDGGCERYIPGTPCD
jgi:hypothetical protein